MKTLINQQNQKTNKQQKAKLSNEKNNKSTNQTTITTNIKILTFIVLIIVAIIIWTPEVIAQSFDIDAKFDEGELKLRGWFNKAAVIALIVTGALWLKGKINWMVPPSIFASLILVNSATEIVAWFS